MSPALAQEIVECLHNNERDVYRAALQGVAEAKKVRPLFLERKPRAQQHQDIAATLAKPQLDFVALNALQTWLVKSQTALLTDFLDALGIPHQKGVVENLPDAMDDAKLKPAVEALLAKHPREKVALYLRAFNDLNDTSWATLAEMLDKDERLQLG